MLLSSDNAGRAVIRTLISFGLTALIRASLLLLRSGFGMTPRAIAVAWCMMQFCGQRTCFCVFAISYPATNNPATHTHTHMPPSILRGQNVHLLQARKVLVSHEDACNSVPFWMRDTSVFKCLPLLQGRCVNKKKDQSSLNTQLLNGAMHERDLHAKGPLDAPYSTPPLSHNTLLSGTSARACAACVNASLPLSRLCLPQRKRLQPEV